MSRLLLKAFLGPFAVTLPVALFILDMQFLWVYADDLVGKGLELWVVFKLMVFASARLVNLALPLAVLVASIMAMGNLAERSELTAMKASGMSFFRILRPLALCMVIVIQRRVLVQQHRLASCQRSVQGPVVFRDQTTASLEHSRGRVLQRH